MKTDMGLEYYHSIRKRTLGEVLESTNGRLEYLKKALEAETNASYKLAIQGGITELTGLKNWLKQEIA